MRAGSLAAVALAAAGCGASRSQSPCENTPTIGEARLPLTRAGALFRVALDGTVRRVGRPMPPPAGTPAHPRRLPAGLPGWPCSGVSSSPDGRLVAVLLAYRARKCGPFAGRLFERRTGRVVARWEGRSGTPETPAWSPDGRWVAAYGSTRFPVVVLSRNGAVRRLPRCRDASWAPSGHRLALTCGDHVVVLDAASGRLTPRSPAASGRPVWSRDGSRLAAVAGGGLVIVAGRRSVTVPLRGCYTARWLRFDDRGRLLVAAGEAPPPD